MTRENFEKLEEIFKSRRRRAINCENLRPDLFPVDETLRDGSGQIYFSTFVNLNTLR